MSPDFKFNLDTIQEGDPVKDGSQGTGGNKDDTNYYQAGSIRNICFKWPDGKHVFLNYSYLVSGEFSPEPGTISLEFTTHSVVLKGFYLEALYKKIMQQFTQFVICLDERYNEIEDQTKPLVNEITISKNT